MNLPAYIASCLAQLEQAGHRAYVVGGCVRDALLGRVPQDYDLCTDATPEEIKAIFSQYRQVLAGESHGTVGVVLPEGIVEITTFRQEGTYRDNRHPDWVRFVTDIREDLRRRDFTVNAIAYSPTQGLEDPFGGREDLQKGILRAVGDGDTRFREDALRILRGIRFAVRFRLTVAPETREAMLRQKELLDGLARERAFSELCKLLPFATVADLLEFSPFLAQILPELAPAIGFLQHSPHHAYDVYTHTAHVTAAVPPVLPLKLAALLHDVGKVPAFRPDENGRGHFYGHAELSAQMADAALLRLKAPTALRQQVVRLIAGHMTPLLPERKLLLRRMGQYGPGEVRQLSLLQQADYRGKGVPGDPSPDFDRLFALLDALEAEKACLTVKDLAVNGKDLLSLGYRPGKALGHCLQQLLRQVQEQTLPNARDALLQAASLWQDTCP